MTPNYRLGKFQTKHDTCWCGVTNVRRKHLRALLGRVVHTLGYVISAFGVTPSLPSFFLLFFSLEISIHPYSS